MIPQTSLDQILKPNPSIIYNTSVQGAYKKFRQKSPIFPLHWTLTMTSLCRHKYCQRWLTNPLNTLLHYTLDTLLLPLPTIPFSYFLHHALDTKTKSSILDHLSSEFSTAPFNSTLYHCSVQGAIEKFQQKSSFVRHGFLLDAHNDVTQSSRIVFKMADVHWRDWSKLYCPHVIYNHFTFVDLTIEEWKNPQGLQNIVGYALTLKCSW